MSCLPLIYTVGEFGSKANWTKLERGQTTTLLQDLTIKYGILNRLIIENHGDKINFELAFGTADVYYIFFERQILLMRKYLGLLYINYFIGSLYSPYKNWVPTIFQQAVSINEPEVTFAPGSNKIFKINFPLPNSNQIISVLHRSDSGLKLWDSNLLTAQDVKSIVQNNPAVESGWRIVSLAINPTRLLAMVPVPCL